MKSEHAAPDPKIADWVARETAGESVLWAGRPDRWAFAQFGNPLAMGLFWLLMTVPTTISYLYIGHVEGWIANQNPYGYYGVLAVFTLLMAAMFHRLWRSRFVYYVVTDRRVLVFSRGWRRKLTTVPATAIAEITRTSVGSAFGQITLAWRPVPGIRRRRNQRAVLAAVPDATAAVAAMERAIVGLTGSTAPRIVPPPVPQGAVAGPPHPLIAETVRREIADEPVIWAGPGPGRRSEITHSGFMLAGFLAFAALSLWHFLDSSYRWPIYASGHWGMSAFSTAFAVYFGLRLWRLRCSYFLVTARRKTFIGLHDGPRVYSVIDVSAEPEPAAAAPTPVSTTT